MLTADNYGNAAAYFTNSSNQATARYLGMFASGKSPVSVYSVVRMAGQGLSITDRADAPSAAVIGWCGPRPVAFTLVPEWNFDTPLT